MSQLKRMEKLEARATELLPIDYVKIQEERNRPAMIALERYWAGEPLTPKEEEFVQRMLPYLPVIEQVVKEQLDREEGLEAG